VIGIAVGVGFLVFRGTVGGQFALKDSDAKEVLVTTRSDEPDYVLISAELGSVAAPLDNGGPDVFLLARLDKQNKTFTLINLPESLQITMDNRSESLASIANSGDAALIRALNTLAKIEISHIVKVDEAGLLNIIEALGGVTVDVDQVVDDPHAGSVYLTAGKQTLEGESALTYLRATNLKYGLDDQLVHQLKFAASLFESLFSAQGGFATRLDSIGSMFQTDYSLADLEDLDSWLSGISAQDITCLTAPGYFTVVTNVTGTDGERYVTTAADMASLIEQLDKGEQPTSSRIDEVGSVASSSFVVDVQNGTITEGAASAAANLLREKGFSIGDVGNAEQPVYEETLVVYRPGDEGLARAKTVIDALGVGRAVEASSYYSFDHDVLVVIGADNKPVA
jgi:LCP family protein required for cell wall assembly